MTGVEMPAPRAGTVVASPAAQAQSCEKDGMAEALLRELGAVGVGEEIIDLHVCSARVELSIPGALTLKDRRRS